VLWGRPHGAKRSFISSPNSNNNPANVRSWESNGLNADVAFGPFMTPTGHRRPAFAVLTREDYRQLAERCALLAGECGAPGVAEALRALALDYLTRAASQKQQQTQRLSR
jgi:hypothetical protein